VVTRTEDVSAEGNTWRKTNFVSSYDMVGLTIEWIGRNVGAKALAIIEFWSEPKVYVKRSQAMAKVGRSMDLNAYHVVALYDPSSGQVVAQHTSSTILGGAAILREGCDRTRLRDDKAASCCPAQ